MNKSKGLQDYLALIVRRRWWVIVTFLALCGPAPLLVASSCRRPTPRRP